MDRLLLLLPTTSYRTQDFLDAAGKLCVEIVCASERPNVFEAERPDNLITLDFSDPTGAARAVAEIHRAHPISAVVPVDDLTTVVAATIAQHLGFKSNPVAAARAARNKHEMRVRLSAARLPVPTFRRVSLKDDPTIAARDVANPCVLKPLMLSASRGVIRADNAAEFVAAFHRIAAILKRPDVAVSGEAAEQILVEDFIPGREVALEGLLVGGILHNLALFDKPDPLDGPFFEETIYVTPSRLPLDMQERIVRVSDDACAVLGLQEGPVHAEFRVNDRGPWIIEVAARSIGGLCSRVLRFGTGMSLEELILRHALGWSLESLERDRGAAGVMMIPIPKGGRLAAVRGRQEALAVKGVEDVAITAHVGQELVPLPEGWQYLGFIFARADTPERAERALRAAHERLDFQIATDSDIEPQRTA